MEVNAADSNVCADGVIAELLDMGFEFDRISQAIGVVGPRRADVLEFMLSSSGSGQTKPSGDFPSRRSVPSNAEPRSIDKRTKLANPRRRFKQPSITDHLASTTGSKRESCGEKASTSYPCLAASIDPRLPVSADIFSKLKPESQSLLESSRGEFDQTDKISAVLQKHFGFSCVKGFQMEALNAWFAHKDCLVLAATGSGMTFF